MGCVFYTFRIIAAILSLALLAFEPLAFAQSNDAFKCADAYDAFGKKSLLVHDASQIEKNIGKIEIKNLFGDSQNVILGITPGDAHCYLLVDDIRYDGNVIKPGKIHTGITAISNGTVIQFKDLPQETIDSLRSNLITKNNSGYMDCYAGACAQLESVGIKLKNGIPLLPTSTFKRLFKDGFFDSEGKPVHTEIYRTNNTSIQNLYDSLNKRQTKRFSGIGALGLAVAISGTMISFVVYDISHN